MTKEITSYLHFFFDELIPPLLRDSRWFMWLPFRILFGRKADIFFGFKDKAYQYSGRELLDVFKTARCAHIKRASDVSKHCLSKLLANVEGDKVLDAGCGRGFLAQRLSGDYQVHASDLFIPVKLPKRLGGVRFQAASVENLPYKDRSFDTVICSHTLEHVKDPQAAVQELRRVSKKRIILVVPKQRPYKYTFDLHLHFFPYRHSFLALVGDGGGSARCEELRRELFYIEERYPYGKQ
ncbi:methyltransferase domain-containing protein [Fibrobacterota bacterium]